MSTQILETIKKRKAELKKQFEEVKKRGAMHEQVMINAKKELDKCAQELTKLTGAYKEVETLEKTLKKK